MKLVATEVLLVMLLAGCATQPVNEACRAGIEKQSEVLYANVDRIRHDSPTGFSLLLSAAEGSELVGDYHGCVKNLAIARSLSNVDIGLYRNDTHPQDTYPPPFRDKKSSSKGPEYDAAHHAAGHTHHHGHPAPTE